MQEETKTAELNEKDLENVVDGNSYAFVDRKCPSCGEITR